jgi:hypothetical protein
MKCYNREQIGINRPTIASRPRILILSCPVLRRSIIEVQARYVLENSKRGDKVQGAKLGCAVSFAARRNEEVRSKNWTLFEVLSPSYRIRPASHSWSFL